MSLKSPAVATSTFSILPGNLPSIKDDLHELLNQWECGRKIVQMVNDGVVDTARTYIQYISYTVHINYRYIFYIQNANHFLSTITNLIPHKEVFH